MVKGYFCSNYSEMDFGLQGMEGLILRYGTLKLLLKILFQ